MPLVYDGFASDAQETFFFWGRRLGAKEKKESARPKIAERSNQQAALTGLQRTVQPKKMIDNGLCEQGMGTDGQEAVASVRRPGRAVWFLRVCGLRVARRASVSE